MAFVAYVVRASAVMRVRFLDRFRAYSVRERASPVSSLLSLGVAGVIRECTWLRSQVLGNLVGSPSAGWAPPSYLEIIQGKSWSLVCMIKYLYAGHVTEQPVQQGQSAYWEYARRLMDHHGS